MLTRKRTWISLFFIVFTFYFLFRNININDLMASFVQFHFLWLLPALFIYLIGYVIRGFRWVVLLSPVKECTFKSLFPTLIIGFMANNVLPARAGEFVRAHLNGKKEGISRSASFATIILERLFDGMTMIIMLWAALGLGHLPIQEQSMPTGIKYAIDLSPYVFGAAFLFLFAMLLFKKTVVRFISIFTAKTPQKIRVPLERITHTFFDGLKILKNIRESFLVLAGSLAAWTCEFVTYYFLAIGMGISPAPFTFWSAALMMAVVNLGILIPNAPGGIGLFEFIGVALLLPFGIAKVTAVGYMFLVHFVVLTPITLLGFYYLTRENLSLGNLDAGKNASETNNGAQ
jgi:glycosyltransferase 2 family protein